MNVQTSDQIPKPNWRTGTSVEAANWSPEPEEKGALMAQLLTPVQDSTGARIFLLSDSLIAVIRSSVGTGSAGYGDVRHFENYLPSATLRSPVHTPPTSSTPSEDLFELRRLSGLTWEQIAQLFGVNRRSVHFWASGKELSITNEERLYRLLDTIRRCYCGSGQATRASLLRPGPQGSSPFDLLAEGRLQEALEILGTPGVRARSHEVSLSTTARASRRPPPPDSLVDALHDIQHETSGRSKAAKSSRRDSGSGSGR